MFEDGIKARADMYARLQEDRVFGQQFRQVLEILLEAVENRKKILIFGNGGSAAEAQHFAAELVCRYQKNRRAIPAIALTTDSSILTAQSNDYEFESIFERQIEALCQQGDVVIGLTTSDVQVSGNWQGHSCNILKAFHGARSMGGRVIGLFSIKTHYLLSFVDLAVVAPSTDTALVQEVHLMLIHELCKQIEEVL